MITRLKLSTIEQGLPKYRSMLAGNDAYVPSSYESIASATGTGSSGTITFSSIPSTYQSLQLRGIMRSTTASASVTSTGIRINSDSSLLYAYHYLYGSGSSVTATGDIDQDRGPLGYNLPLNSITSNVMGVIIIDIHNYASTTQNKTIRTFSGCDTNDANGVINLSSQLYRSTNAVSSISIIAGSGSFTTTTQFALYGIKGA